MPLQSNLQSGYEAAVELAVQQFEKSDPDVLARLCLAEFNRPDSTLLLDYLGHTYSVHHPSGQIQRVGDSGDAPLTTRILILDYVLGAKSQQPTGDLISFRDIPGAAMYEPSFQKRAVNPLVYTFDGKPELLLAAAEQIGGKPAQVADISVVIHVLPLIPITYGIWHGDEEFPASGVILFDSSARRLLTIECLVVAAANGVYEMMKIARTLPK